MAVTQVKVTQMAVTQMTADQNLLTLTDWRRQVAELYAATRANPNPHGAWEVYRIGRNALFKSHPETPLNEAQLATFTTLPYYEYDISWRVVGRLDRHVERETFDIQLSADGVFRYTRVAKVHFELHNQPATLSLFSINGYGGGLFLPFSDAT